MAAISRSHGYLFLLAPRTASTAVADVMCKQLDAEFIPGKDVVRQGVLVVERKHSTVPQLVAAGLLTREEVAGLRVITTVRNPFDSLVSLWVKKRTSYVPLLDDPKAFIHRSPSAVDDIRFAVDHTFDEWVRRNYGGRHHRPSHMYAKFIDDADVVMRYERLQDDFDLAMGALGIDPVPVVPRINPTESKEPDYRQYYSRRSRRTVARAYRPDLDRFGYRF